MTGIQVFRFVHGAEMKIIFLENPVDALFFDAGSATAGTVLPELDYGVFADGVVSRRCCFY
jgi:hypothetical protein